MEYSNAKGDRRRRWKEVGDWYSVKDHTRDGRFIWDPDLSIVEYIQNFYRGTKGRQSKAFRPSKPRWKK